MINFSRLSSYSFCLPVYCFLALSNSSSNGLKHSFHDHVTQLQKALIGGNWKCNGTVESVKKMINVLNAAGPLSTNSEVNLLIILMYMLLLDSSHHST